FLTWVRRHLLCRVEGVTDRFALTFDDGPSARTTPYVLDLLARHGARATFFVLGRHVRQHPHLVRRAVEEGHEVGLHGHAHLPLFFLSGTASGLHFETAVSAIWDAAGV